MSVWKIKIVGAQTVALKRRISAELICVFLFCLLSRLRLYFVSIFSLSRSMYGTRLAQYFCSALWRGWHNDRIDRYSHQWRALAQIEKCVFLSSFAEITFKLPCVALNFGLKLFHWSVKLGDRQRNCYYAIVRWRLFGVKSMKTPRELKCSFHK